MEFEFPQPVFKKSSIFWPQQPLTDLYQILVKIWIFHDQFYKKGPALVILMPEMIKLSRAGSSLSK